MNHVPPLFLRLLGGTALLCEGAPRPLPKSRKTRALLAYLAIEARAVRRETLCEMFWESTSDPRAALRWSLTQLRPVLASPRGQALEADNEAIALSTDLLRVDVRDMRALLGSGAIDLTDARLQALEEALNAGLSGDLDLAQGHRYGLWLGGEREAVRQAHRRVLDEQSARADSPVAALAAARKRAVLDPFDSDANARYLACSVEVDGRDRARLALEDMRERYRAEGLSDHALVAGWRGLKPADVFELPDKPSVAVLGFSDLGGHTDGPVLSEGLAADLTLMLGRFSDLFVSARASAARFSRNLADPSLVGRMLGVRYLVHGTTQRLDRRVRVTVTLSDTQPEAVIWSEHFDRSLADLFAVQDDISTAIASAIEPEIMRAEAQRAGLKAPEDLSAWACYHRAMWHCYHFTAQHTERAHALLQRALALEKGFARAHAGLSFTHYARAFLDSTPAHAAAVAWAIEHGQRSVELDSKDAMGYWTLGRAQFLAREHDQALQSVNRCVTLNPSFSQGHYARGFLEAHSGLHVQALPDLDTAERLSPLDPLLFAVEGTRAISMAIEGRYDQAAAWSVRATSEPNAHFHIQAIAGACLALAGREAEARAFARRAGRGHPGYSLRTFERSFPQKFERHQTLMAQALRRAGVPDDGR